MGQVYFECLMFMNFVTLIYCVKHALLSFSMNESFAPKMT
jgi:hypothetical protein